MAREERKWNTQREIKNNSASSIIFIHAYQTQTLKREEEGIEETVGEGYIEDSTYF